MECADGFGRRGLDRIGDRQQTDKLLVDRHEHDGAALLLQAIGSFV